MTEKLYYEDSHLAAFDALVTGCEAGKKGFLVTLDRTTFFPEGGGQPADTGWIGQARVTDVHERDGRILHDTDRPLPVGERLACRLDFEQRWRRMQNHSGEHIFSGLTHSRHGLENVGFHMGADCMTIDFDGELSWEQLTEIETEANRVVRADLPIRTWFPQPEELQSLSYRSKLELTENVRLVQIPGVDLCACCAPHVSRTGEVGLVKLLTAERHRGGVRITLVCGMDALEDYRRRQESVTAISNLLSAKRDQVVPAVERLLEQQSAQKERLALLGTELARRKAEQFPETEGNLCVFDSVLDEISLRELVNLLADKCTGMAGAFSGSDETGYRYIIGSRHVDLRANSRHINAAIGGRGGGSPEMIQGRAAGDQAQILRFFETGERP